MTSHNYMSVNPTYELTAVYPDQRGSAVFARADVLLTGLTEKEAKAFSTYFIRQGADIGIKRTQPFSIRADFVQRITDDEIAEAAVVNDAYREDGRCGDCGGDLYGPGAPAICAAGHLCRDCDLTHYNCKCPTAQ